MYKFAYREEDVVVLYDAKGNQYVARGGNLAWRINNPGLVHHHCRFAKKHGSLGAWEKFAIFSTPLQGHKSLVEWLHSKKYSQSNLRSIAEHYDPSNTDDYLKKLSIATAIPPSTKIGDLSDAEFERLVREIENMCGYDRLGNEEFYLVPKIIAKLESHGDAETYLVNDTILTKSEALAQIASHRLDAVVVHQRNGSVYLRSRPRHRMTSLKLTWDQHCMVAGELDTLRAVGQKTPGQCIWGFINGIGNTKENALESCDLISQYADNELVLSLPNDTLLLGVKDATVCLLLKLAADTPIVVEAANFFRRLLKLSDEASVKPPVIVFAHSQGAAIATHALELLNPQERQEIRVFTFGGWSFIAEGAAHPESHNYTSTGDLIPWLGSCTLQCYAMRRHDGLKDGLSEEETAYRLASQDAVIYLDSLDPQAIHKYAQERSKYYLGKFEKVKNVTIIDAGRGFEHAFKNISYQTIVKKIVESYKQAHCSLMSQSLNSGLLVEALV